MIDLAYGMVAVWVCGLIFFAVRALNYLRLIYSNLAPNEHYGDPSQFGNYRIFLPGTGSPCPRLSYRPRKAASKEGGPELLDYVRLDSYWLGNNCILLFLRCAARHGRLNGLVNVGRCPSPASNESTTVDDGPKAAHDSGIQIIQRGDRRK
jgi:hypothetical protein